MLVDHNTETRYQLQGKTKQNKKKTVRKTKTWRLNNTFLNNQQVTARNQREIFKKFQKQMTMKT